MVVDSEIYWDRHCLETYQQIIPAYDEEYDKKLKGRNAHDIYEMLKVDFGITFSKEEYFAHLSTFTDRLYGEITQLLPAIPELVDWLQRKHIPTAIASSGDRMWLEIALKRLKMFDRFSPIVTAADVGIGKPDPAVFLEAARILNVDPKDCVALEDSTNGVASAKAAGMYCIGLHHTEGYSQDLRKADMEINRVEELTEELLNKL